MRSSKERITYRYGRVERLARKLGRRQGKTLMQVWHRSHYVRSRRKKLFVHGGCHGGEHSYQSVTRVWGLLGLKINIDVAFIGGTKRVITMQYHSML